MSSFVQDGRVLGGEATIPPLLQAHEAAHAGAPRHQERPEVLYLIMLGKPKIFFFFSFMATKRGGGDKGRAPKKK